jgi:uncharacterized SAM-binding protein YcdF (DUF218 family)
MPRIPILHPPEVPKGLRKALFFLGVFGTGLALGVLGLAYFLAGDIYDYQDTVDGVHLPKVDAIVCLAGGRGRISMAGDIWYRYWELGHAPVKGIGPSPVPAQTPTLYISGMGPNSTWSVLARQVRRGVLEVLKPVDVVLETESQNTEENALWLARYAKDRGWDHILLITSRYHMKRSRVMFERVLAKAGLNVAVETLSVYQEPFEPGEWREGFHGIRVTMIEYLKWIFFKSLWKP